MPMAPTFRQIRDKTRSFIKVPRDKRAGGYPPAPARDWYKSNNPRFKIRTFLASSGCGKEHARERLEHAPLTVLLTTPHARVLEEVAKSQLSLQGSNFQKSSACPVPGARSGGAGRREAAGNTPGLGFRV